MTHYDILVIGSGGGAKLVGPSAARGLRVALVEKGKTGGTCLNRGCIPSKMMLYPAEVSDLIRRAAAFGLDGVGCPRADFARIVSRVTAAVDEQSAQLRAGYDRQPGVDYFEGQARFTAERTVEINNQRLTADKIFIAVGAHPHIPDIPGLADVPYLTSTEALRLTLLPEKMIVIGAGYIAAELGYAYRAFGTDVHFLVRSRFLRHEDSEIAAEFDRVFSREHHVHHGFTATEVCHDGGRFTVRGHDAEGPAAVEGDALLVAAGVEPCTRELGLESAGIELTPAGHVRVNGRLRTTAEGVYALGDCIGRHLFRHTVNFEGEYLFRTAVAGHGDEPLDYGPVPHAVFTHPQIAGVGETEEDLCSRGADYIVGRADYTDSTPGMARLADHGFVKILVDRRTERVLGAHILGEEASNMIHLFIALMKKTGTLQDLLDMIFIHPALPEVARDAARDAARRR